MMKHGDVKQWVVLTGVFSVILMTGWYLVTEETRSIKRMIRDIQEGFRREDIPVCLGYLSNDYLDDYGYRPEDIAPILREAFGSLEDINVIILDRQIDRRSGNAVVHLEFRVVATHQLGVRGYIIGSMKQPAYVEVRLKKPEKFWQVYSISRIGNV